MRRSLRVACCVGLTAASLAAGCSRTSPEDRAWAAAVKAARKSKDAFIGGPEGPLAPEGRAAYTGLRYFDPDRRFVCTGQLERVVGPDTVQFPTSKGSFDPYRRVGRIHFELGGAPRLLTLFASIPDDHLFLPFTDATSGDETYGAGRYLDVEIQPGNRLQLDFNLAYNPYCAYDASWICPLAPAENHLQLRIAAGERVYPHAP